MGISGFDPTESRIELERLRERLRYLEDKVREKDEVLAQVYANLGRKETELERVRDERDDLKIKWTELKGDLKHLQDLLAQSSQRTTKKRGVAKIQAFFASIIFLVAALLSNLGNSMLTSNPSNSLGGFMITLAVVAYVIAALMTTLLALEGGN
jgi:hypothetical protein